MISGSLLDDPMYRSMQLPLQGYSLIGLGPRLDQSGVSVWVPGMPLDMDTQYTILFQVPSQGIPLLIYDLLPATGAWTCDARWASGALQLSSLTGEVVTFHEFPTLADLLEIAEVLREARA